MGINADLCKRESNGASHDLINISIMIRITISAATTYRGEELGIYISQVNRYKPLAKDDANDLVARAAKGDKRAQDKLVEHNLRFVITVAKKYQGMGLPLEDLISEGNIGLLMAARKFDPSRGVNFISYAVHWIQFYITRALSEKSRVVRMPCNHTQDNYCQVSGDAQIGDENDDFNLFAQMRNEDTADKGDELDAISHKLAVLLSRLSPRERDIICSLYGINGREQTMQEIAKRYKMTEERVRQIKWEVIDKLKNMK